MSDLRGRTVGSRPAYSLECVFHNFLETVSLSGTYHGYRLFAVDGSDLRMPTNSNDPFSVIQNEDGGKHYNLVHLNAMYDLVNHTCEAWESTL